VAIEFDGVYMDSRVWINGHLLGRRPNGYISFRYDLTPHVKYGETNHIAVRVNVEPGGSRWYPGAGIYRRVWLTTMHPVHVAHWGTYVTTPGVSKEEATVRLRTEVENQTDRGADVILDSVIFDRQGRDVAKASTPHPVAAGGRYEFDQTFVVSRPQLWSPDTPDLYEVVSTVRVDGRPVDTYTTPLGIRTFTFTADRGFFLNGEHVDIKGVCLHHDFGPLGTAFYPRALERQFEILRDMGVNAIRTSHNPRDPAFYAMCDRMGFMVMNEAFDVWEASKLPNDFHQFFKEWSGRDLADMVRRDRNHPSIVIWSIGNEVNEQHQNRVAYPTQGGDIAAKLAAICKQHDPSRPVTAACNSRSASEAAGIVEALDVYGQNYGLTAYQQFNRDKPVIGTENATSFITRGSYSYAIVRDQGIRLEIQNFKNNRECTGYGKFWGNDRTDGTLVFMRQNPHIAGQFAWTGFDYLGECFPFKWPARNGLFGIVDMVGFPKDSYYAYQSDWTDEPMVHILPQQWNWPQFVDMPMPVWVYSNGDEVELFLNGKSLGVKHIDRNETLHAEWDVKYAPGELKAVARNNGQVVSTDIVRTPGEPARIELTADRREIAADGNDLSFLEIRLTDANGVNHPDADRMVQVDVEGDGMLVGVGNGDAFDHEPFKGNRVRTFYGLCRAIVKSTTQAGSITVKVRADGVEGDAVAIIVLPADHPRLAAEAAERDAQARVKSRKHSRHRIVGDAGVERLDPATETAFGIGIGAGATATEGPGALIVAPVFRHGPGQHVDSVIESRNTMPPTWSKADACRVIVDEAMKHGLELTVLGDKPRVDRIVSTCDGQASSSPIGTPVPLTFDGVSRDGKVVFEVLTAADVPARTDNTDSITDFIGAAEQLAGELKAKNGGYVVGVFYDPLVAHDGVPDEAPLRRQVRDFVAWLKKDGKRVGGQPI
jgi:beta-galactosidase